jgi:hypothetical protein
MEWVKLLSPNFTVKDIEIKKGELYGKPFKMVRSSG